MKIRSGFVSNSSSSSFVLKLIKDDEDVCPHCGRGDKDLLTYLRASSTYSDHPCDNKCGIRAVGKDEVVKYMRDAVDYWDVPAGFMAKLEKMSNRDRLVVITVGRGSGECDEVHRREYAGQLKILAENGD